MKQILTLVFFLPFVLNAQTDTVKQNKLETIFQYSLQCPIYSVNTPADLALPQDPRYRSRIGIGIKYYPLKNWYAAYFLSFSQEGGGNIEQRTNANYFKNSILIGYSSSHSRLIIFDIFCGVDINFLMNANIKYAQSNDIVNVLDYYNRFNLSFPVGCGLKTKIFKEFYFSCHTFISLSPYSISKEPYIKVSQIIFPAFQIGLTKFIK